MKKILIALTAWLVSLGCLAQENNYLATVWGAKSDGITDNTASFQRAIDFISAHGGGTLSIYVGRYLTGAIELKDNVTLYLGEGAVLVGPTNFYDYNGAPALIWSKDAKNVAIKGKGVIECRHKALEANIKDQVAKGYLPADTALPGSVSLGISAAGIDPTIKVLTDTAQSTRYSTISE